MVGFARLLPSLEGPLGIPQSQLNSSSIIEDLSENPMASGAGFEGEQLECPIEIGLRCL